MIRPVTPSVDINILCRLFQQLMSRRAQGKVNHPIPDGALSNFPSLSGAPKRTSIQCRLEMSSRVVAISCRLMSNTFVRSSPIALKGPKHARGNSRRHRQFCSACSCRAPHPERHPRSLRFAKFAKNAAHKSEEDKSAETRLRPGGGNRHLIHHLTKTKGSFTVDTHRILISFDADRRPIRSPVHSEIASSSDNRDFHYSLRAA
jgi:hypothetical protein